MRADKRARSVMGALSTALCAASMVSPASTASLLITNARIVDVREGAVGPLQDIEVSGGRIKAIRAAGSARTGSSGQPLLDAGGKYVVPGYWDMHVHVNGHESERWMLPMFVVAGVTGVRDMSGDCVTPGCTESLASMRSMQQRVARGELVGPRIVAISSAQVDGPHSLEEGAPAWSSPGTAEDARALVRDYKARGVDFIKPYNSMPPEAYFEMLYAASADGLRLSGHIPMSVSVLQAVRAGQHTIEHAIRPALDCGVYSDGLHQRYARWAAGESAEGNEKGYYPQILASFDVKRCDAIVAGIASTRAWYVPTHVTRRFEARADEPGFVEDARLRLVPPDVLDFWKGDAAGQKERFEKQPGQKRAYVAFYELGLRLTGQMHAAGVPVLVGSDALDSYAFPGTATHDEMLELRKAGLSNAAILRAATLSAAEFLGREAEFGTVEAGKAADLVLLAANPLTDIANAAKVEAVVLAGALYDGERRRRLESEVAAYVASR